jgi:uncharacterized membrane protein SpoIIM required for sporulation
MISNRWLEARKVHWNRLADLLRRAEGGLKRLSGSELQELGLLYRQTAADVSSVGSDASSAHIAAYLNQLLGKSHNIIYRGQRASSRGAFAFLRDEYPRHFRSMWMVTAVATAVFLAGALGGWAVTARDPAFAYRVLGPRMMESIEQQRMWTESIVSMKPAASSLIATNNIAVTFSTFALGITGLGTLWMMLFNGLMLGVVGAATAHAGMATALWSFVAPHGVLELPAICIAGGAGLEIARGLFFPGLLPRRDSLAIAGRNAALLLGGTIPMLLIAGTIEGFFSPSNASPAVKFSLAAVLLIALLVYLFGTARHVSKQVAVLDAKVLVHQTTGSLSGRELKREHSGLS